MAISNQIGSVVFVLHNHAPCARSTGALQVGALLAIEFVQRSTGGPIGDSYKLNPGGFGEPQGFQTGIPRDSKKGLPSQVLPGVI